MKRLLTIGHSYVVAQNRRLAHEMAIQGQGRWQVTAAAPVRLAGDLRDLDLEPIPGEACDVRPLDVRLGVSPHLRYYGPALRSLMRERWDVIHLWEEPYVVAAAQIARGAPRSAAVVPATFQNISKRYPPPFRYIEHSVMRRAQGWIAFGRTVHEAMCSRPLYPSKPSRVITPGVDTRSFRPDPLRRDRIRTQLGWAATDRVVGFAGRFVPEKGIHLLLDALARTSSTPRVLFVGGGRLAPALERFAAGRPGRVAVRTNVSHDAVPAYLNAMDVICVPSRSTSRWREQFGRVLVEAMASGVPILASPTGEIPFVVKDAAVLVAPDDAHGWAASIDALLDDEDRRAELAVRGLSRAARVFAWPAIARAHLDFFEALVSDRCAA